MTAVERGAPPDDCLRAAGGIYLRERQSAVEALLRLLQARSFPDTHAPRIPNSPSRWTPTSSTSSAAPPRAHRRDPPRPPHSSRDSWTSSPHLPRDPSPPRPPRRPRAPTPDAGGAVVVQTSPGASLQTPGGATLAPAPAPRTEVSSDPHAASAALEHVADERGRPCRRSEWFAHERRLTAECLYHAVLSTRRDGGAVSGADAAKIAEVFATVAAPTLAATVAHDRARRAAEAFARMDAAAPPLAIFPDHIRRRRGSTLGDRDALRARRGDHARGGGRGGCRAVRRRHRRRGDGARRRVGEGGGGGEGARSTTPARALTAIRFAPRSRDPRSPTPRRPRDPSAATELSAAATGLSAAATSLSAAAPPPRTVCFIRRGRARAPVRDTRAVIRRVRICSRRTAARRRPPRRRFTSRGSCGR